MLLNNNRELLCTFDAVKAFYYFNASVQGWVCYQNPGVSSSFRLSLKIFLHFYACKMEKTHFTYICHYSVLFFLNRDTF